jgi:hypothetical protein
MKTFLLLLLLLNCSLAFTQKKFATNDAWVGVYKLDLEKSKFSGPTPQEETISVAAARKDSIQYTIAGKNVNGNSYTIDYKGKADAESTEMMEGKPLARITYHMKSPREFTSEARGADGSTGTGTVTLSKDGKTISVHQRNKTAQGAEQENTIVYLKQ